MAFLQNEQKQVLSQKLDPKLFLTQQLLQCNVQERTLSVENELLENPALELTEYAETLSADGEDLGTDDFNLRSSTTPRPDPFVSLSDPENSLASHETPIELRDHLTNQLSMLSLSPQERLIAEYIIGNLNDNGFLTDTVESLATDLKTEQALVEKVLAQLQTLDPPGVVARNLQECLLLQMKHLLPDIAPNTALWEIAQTAYRILKEGFDDFVAQRQYQLARRLIVSRNTLQKAIDFICHRLTPYPAARFGSHWGRPFGEPSIRPDVIVHRTEIGFQIEIAGYSPEHLRVSPIWQENYDKLLMVRATSEEINYIREYVRRASLFIESFRNCHKILRALTQELILCQTAFIETGQVQFLRPLTRASIAAKLHVHPSIVSRATYNKYIQLPNREIYSFSIFFDYSMVIKIALKQLISAEDPYSPLTDKELAEKLREMGFDVARRTVVKYREENHILPSHLRRRYN